MTYNPFVCTIVFGLSESSKITLFKDLVRKIIEAELKSLFKLIGFIAWLTL